MTQDRERDKLREKIAHIKLAENEGITVEGVPKYIKAEVIGLTEMENAFEYADQILALLSQHEQDVRREGFSQAIQAVIDYLQGEIDTIEERSAGKPELKAHFNAMEKVILKTVINAFADWQALKNEEGE